MNLRKLPQDKRNKLLGVVVGTLATIQEKVGDAKLPHLYLVYAGDGLTEPNRGSQAAK